MLENVAAKEHAFPFDRNKLNSQQYESLDDPDAVEYGTSVGIASSPRIKAWSTGFKPICRAVANGTTEIAAPESIRPFGVTDCPVAGFKI